MTAGASRARDLAYGLYRRTLHPEILPVVRSETVEQGTYRAKLMILEPAGHAVSFALAGGSPGQVLVEVVLPLSLELPRTGRIDWRPLAHAARDRVKTKGDVLYECSYAVEVCSASEFAHRYQRVLAATPKGARLVVEHGPKEGSPAFSLIDYETKPSSLEAFAVHAFPPERTFVFVQSAFGAAPRRDQRGE